MNENQIIEYTVQAKNERIRFLESMLQDLAQYNREQSVQTFPQDVQVNETGHDQIKKYQRRLRDCQLKLVNMAHQVRILQNTTKKQMTKDQHLGSVFLHNKYTATVPPSIIHENSQTNDIVSIWLRQKKMILLTLILARITDKRKQLKKIFHVWQTTISQETYPIIVTAYYSSLEEFEKIDWDVRINV